MRKSLILAACLLAGPASAQPAASMQQAVDAVSVQACAGIMKMRDQINTDQSDVGALRQQIVALQQKIAEISKPSASPDVGTAHAAPSK